jgi:hypothetical protein
MLTTSFLLAEAAGAIEPCPDSSSSANIGRWSDAALACPARTGCAVTTDSAPRIQSPSSGRSGNAAGNVGKSLPARFKPAGSRKRLPSDAQTSLKSPPTTSGVS